MRWKPDEAMIRVSMNGSGYFPNLFRPRTGHKAVRRLLLLPASLIALTLFIPFTLKAQDDLQSFVNNLMSGRRGAALVTNPMTGEVLAVRSARRVFGEAFPPGSTAKIVEAAALLEERKVGRRRVFIAAVSPSCWASRTSARTPRSAFRSTSKPPSHTPATTSFRR